MESTTEQDYGARYMTFSVNNPIIFQVFGNKSWSTTEALWVVVTVLAVAKMGFTQMDLGENLNIYFNG